MKECDRLSVVTYDTKVRLDFGLMHMDEANKEKTKAMVKDIRDGSSTNLCGGLIKGTVLHACTTFRVVTTTQTSQVKDISGAVLIVGQVGQLPYHFWGKNY